MTIDITNMYPGLNFLWYTIPLGIGVLFLIGSIVVGIIDKDIEYVGAGLLFLVGSGAVAFFGCLIGSIAVMGDKQNAIDTQLERTGRYISIDPVEEESNTYIGIRPDDTAEKFFLRAEDDNIYRILPIE